MRKIKEYKYDIICYTASIKQYADEVLDYIEGDERFFSRRLYRNNCIKTQMGDESCWVKDLRIFNKVDLKDVVIVDNSILSFANHLDNGIPILPYYDNKNDRELEILTNYLKHLASTIDLRLENKKLMRCFYHDTSSASEDECSKTSRSNIFDNGAKSDKNLTQRTITEESYFSNSDLSDSYLFDFDFHEKLDLDQSVKLLRHHYDNFKSNFTKR